METSSAINDPHKFCFVGFLLATVSSDDESMPQTLEPHSINDYKVALVRLGVKLPTGQRSKSEYQQLYDGVQQRQQGKRKQPMTPTEPATGSQTKQAKKPRTASVPRATRPRADAQQPTPPAQPQASSSTVGRPAARRPAPASLPRPAAVPPRQPAAPPRQPAAPPRQPAAAWMPPMHRPAAAVSVPPSLFAAPSHMPAAVPSSWAVAPVSARRSAEDVWRERPWRAAVALLALVLLGGALAAFDPTPTTASVPAPVATVEARQATAAVRAAAERVATATAAVRAAEARVAAETAAVTLAAERAAAAQRVRASTAASPPPASLGTLFEGWIHAVLAAPGDALLSHALYPLAAAASSAADAVRNRVAIGTRRAAAAAGAGAASAAASVRAAVAASATALALAASAAAAALAVRAAVRRTTWRRRGRGFVCARGWLAIPPKLPLDAVSLAQAAAVPVTGEAAADALQTADALRERARRAAASTAREPGAAAAEAREIAGRYTAALSTLGDGTAAEGSAAAGAAGGAAAAGGWVDRSGGTLYRWAEAFDAPRALDGGGARSAHAGRGYEAACASFNLGAALATLATQRELKAAAELFQQARNPGWRRLQPYGGGCNPLRRATL